MQGIHRKERENRKRKTLLTLTGLLMEGTVECRVEYKRLFLRIDSSDYLIMVVKTGHLWSVCGIGLFTCGGGPEYRRVLL